jgi:hypothetical protein
MLRRVSSENRVAITASAEIFTGGLPVGDGAEGCVAETAAAAAITAAN